MNGPLKYNPVRSLAGQSFNSASYLFRMMVDAAVADPERAAAELLPLFYEIPRHLPVIHIVNIRLSNKKCNLGKFSRQKEQTFRKFTHIPPTAYLTLATGMKKF
jgi:hypothetical protein